MSREESRRRLSVLLCLWWNRAQDCEACSAESIFRQYFTFERKGVLEDESHSI